MLDKIKNIFNGWIAKASKSKDAVNDAARKSIAEKTKIRYLVWVGLLVLFVILQVSAYYPGSKKIDKSTDTKNAPLKIEVAAQSLDAEKMWRNYFEEKLSTANTESTKAIDGVNETINSLSQATQQSLNAEISKLNQQITFLKEEHGIARVEMSSVKEKLNQEGGGDFKEREMPANVVVNKTALAQNIEPPKSQYNFIPETAYLHGVLLGGISVSTALGSSAEPVPVIIRITDKGNLPKNFALDLTKCQILGASYGDLSSERAIVRAEVLSCRDDKAELVHTTKIAGVVYGDDGMNGIKGKVIQTSSKHLRNAIVGSMIGGFANTAKGQESTVFNQFGATTSSKSSGDLLKAGGFAGTANAADKIAEYYIKQAEAMSPVLSVSGGVKVDVVFTKGVVLNTQDVSKKLEQQRKNKD